MIQTALKILNSTLFDTDQMNYCVATTGSDGRQEKVGVDPCFELIAIFEEPNETNDSIIIRIKSLINEKKFFSDIEIKYLKNGSILSYEGKENSPFISDSSD